MLDDATKHRKKTKLLAVGNQGSPYEEMHTEN